MRSASPPRCRSWSAPARAQPTASLIRSAEALETAHKLDTVILDKTGTITRGRPTLTDVAALPGASEAELVRLVASAEQPSEHPLGGAIVAGARDRGVALVEPTGFDP